MTVEILIGDCRASLQQMAEKSIHTCVTSPPYFGLRDYGVDGQLGLELTPEAFVVGMVEVFREVRRVLRDDGTVWLNLGDSYATQGGDRSGHQNHSTLGGGKKTQIEANVARRSKCLPAKQRMMIPARCALALQADGWWLRDEIIWHKPNPMPASVTDRTTSAHEMIYLLSKSPSYFYDANAIRENAVKGAAGSTFNTGKTAEHQLGRSSDAMRIESDTRNRRSVWTVSTKPFKGAHFATFPPDLIEPCILAGCPVGGTVLDPFGGAGTTGLVAQAHGRNAVLCELNPEYAAMARERIDEAVATPLAAKKIRAKAAKPKGDDYQVTLF